MRAWVPRGTGYLGGLWVACDMKVPATGPPRDCGVSRHTQTSLFHAWNIAKAMPMLPGPRTCAGRWVSPGVAHEPGAPLMRR